MTMGTKRGKKRRKIEKKPGAFPDYKEVSEKATSCLGPNARFSIRFASDVCHCCNERVTSRADISTQPLACGARASIPTNSSSARYNGATEQSFMFKHFLLLIAKRFIRSSRLRHFPCFLVSFLFFFLRFCSIQLAIALVNDQPS